MNAYKISIFVLILFFLTNCATATIENVIFASPKSSEPDSLNYIQFKANAKLALQQNSANKSTQLFHFISDSIPKYWIGTAWDFNGVSQTPRQGEIACGYFVTNILSHIGYQIRRIFLAQQVSSVMIKELTTDIGYFTSIEKLTKYLDRQEKQTVYIIGLDFHTGFITKDENEYYFIHSNYINNEGVIKEKINNSAALLSSKNYMIGKLKLP